MACCEASGLHYQECHAGCKQRQIICAASLTGAGFPIRRSKIIEKACLTLEIVLSFAEFRKCSELWIEAVGSDVVPRDVELPTTINNFPFIMSG